MNNPKQLVFPIISEKPMGALCCLWQKISDLKKAFFSLSLTRVPIQSVQKPKSCHSPTLCAVHVI